VTPVVNKPTTTRLFDQDVMEKKPELKKPVEPKKPEDPKKYFEALLTKLTDLVKKDDPKEPTVTPPAVSTKPKPPTTATPPVVSTKPTPVVETPPVITAPPATETPKKPVFDYGAV
jgi:hypothetical protein